MKTYPLPRLTAAEWRAIKKQIPKPKAGPAPRFDRQIIAAVLYAEAAACTIERLPPGYPPAASIRTRTQRWQRTGTLSKILRAAAPAILRMHDAYRARLSDLSPWGDDWQFGRKRDDAAFHNLPRR